ncbi:MAG: FecR domain-containing protein [Steroidobacteraceae bacterium]
MNGQAEKPSPSNRAAEEAAGWFLRLQEDTANTQTFVDWQNWLTAASEHRIAYDEIEDTVLRLRQSSAMPVLPSAAEMAVDTYDGSKPLAEWNKRSRESTAAGFSHSGRTRFFWYGMAASITIASLFGGWLWLQHPSHVHFGSFAYQTAPGQQKAFQLPEGSTVTLDADSALDVELSSNLRSLTLKRGEAYFEVAKDKTWPFVVRAGAAQVTAVGTAFNIRMSDDQTVVAVTEGKVEVVTAPKDVSASAGIDRQLATARPRLTAQIGAGEAVSYADDGNRLQALPATIAPLATAWLNGRRQYRNEQLRYVLADIDRYTAHRIDITDEAAELRFTGTLNLENIDVWIRSLPVALPVKVTEHDDGSLSVAMRTGP